MSQRSSMAKESNRSDDDGFKQPSKKRRISSTKVFEEFPPKVKPTRLTFSLFPFSQKSLPDESADCAGPSNLDDDKDGDKDAKKKKNRCVTCRKKVGLTGEDVWWDFHHPQCADWFVLGFECRCGGLYCAIHRYSDKHECSFDYREHGAAEIRRNNPVVVGEKIQKIWSVCRGAFSNIQFKTMAWRIRGGGTRGTVNSRCV